MWIIGWIVLGLIAGFIASKIVYKAGSGFFINIVLGIRPLYLHQGDLCRTTTALKLRELVIIPQLALLRAS